MKVALLSTGLGTVHRGFEVFFQDLFHKLSREIDVTLLKGGGSVESSKEKVLPVLSRDSIFWKLFAVCLVPLEVTPTFSDVS